jgi:predicted amidohydrolase
VLFMNDILSSELLLGLVQMSMSDNPYENLHRALSGIREASKRGAAIVCLPELFRTPYFCTEEACEVDYSEELPGVAGNELSSLAKDLGVVIVGGSVYQKTDQGNFNTALIYDSDGTLLGDYRKTHIPHDPAFFEQNYFKPSESNYKVFTVHVNGRKVTIGVLICYDQWFPEAARSLALMGAEIIFYPTAIGTVQGVVQDEGDWHDAWRTVQRGHAIANATIVAAVNRVGKEGNSVFWGGSFVSDAFGRVLAEGTNREEIVIAPVSLSHNNQVKEGWRFFKERRPDTYGLLTRPRADFNCKEGE